MWGNMTIKSYCVVALATLASAAVSGCTIGTVGGPLPPLAVSDALTRVAASPIYKIVDHESFANVKVNYPAPQQPHTIPAGDYLLSKVVTAIPKGRSINRFEISGLQERMPTHRHF